LIVLSGREKLDLTHKILVVEDQKNDRMALVRMLRMKFPKYNIFEAENGKEGYDLYKKQRPDIILTDIRMPIMDGVKLINIIRAEDTKTPIIVISAFEKEMFNIDELHISYYLLKPITILHLFNILSEFLDEE
jgi:YesN/AraC family two-component response regulator